MSCIGLSSEYHNAAVLWNSNVCYTDTDLHFIRSNYLSDSIESIFTGKDNAWFTNAKNVINKDLNSISKIFNKYNNSNLILIYSHFESNLYNIEIHLMNDNSLIFLENLKINNLNYETFFTNLKFKVLENWKANNFIQNTKVNKIECLVNSLNIYELQKINSLIKSISIISDYKLMKIKLYKNLYEISYFGNYDIFNKLLSMKSININLIKDKCEINLI